jgi:hypothetical protein
LGTRYNVQLDQVSSAPGFPLTYQNNWDWQQLSCMIQTGL